MSCYMYKSDFHATIDDEDHGQTEVNLIDYVDRHWSLKFGNFAGCYEVRLTTEDLRGFLDNIVEALTVNDEEMAWQSGDYETDPKVDERNTEAWLDKEG